MNESAPHAQVAEAVIPVAADKQAPEDCEAVVNLPGRCDYLPGERSFDRRILERAVRDLNAMYTVGGLETARAVGDYILATFFEHDREAFRTRGRQHVTFRGLAAREDLGMSYSFIWYSVAVLEQLEQLPSDVAEALPLSHHRLLLPIEDSQLKLNLAVRARDEGMSKRDLERVIRGLRGKSPLKKKGRGGRPPLPAFVKGLRQLEKAVDLAQEQDICPELVNKFSNEGSKDLLAKLYRQMQQLHELAEGLRQAIEQVEHDHALEQDLSEDAKVMVAAK